MISFSFSDKKKKSKYKNSLMEEFSMPVSDSPPPAGHFWHPVFRTSTTFWIILLPLVFNWPKCSQWCASCCKKLQYGGCHEQRLNACLPASQETWTADLCFRKHNDSSLHMPWRIFITLSKKHLASSCCFVGIVVRALQWKSTLISSAWDFQMTVSKQGCRIIQFCKEISPMGEFWNCSAQRTKNCM